MWLLQIGYVSIIPLMEILKPVAAEILRGTNEVVVVLQVENELIINKNRNKNDKIRIE